MIHAHKPVRRKVPARVPYGVSETICVTIYPNGTIGLRELGRRREYTLGIGTLYVAAVAADAARERAEKKAARKAGRKETSK